MLKFLFEQGHFHNHKDGFIIYRCLWGDIKNIDSSSKVYKKAVKSYQQMHNLLDDGVFGPVSRKHTAIRRCGLPDIMERRADLSEWPPACQRKITTSHTIDSLIYTGHGSINEAWDYGITRWNLVSDVFLNRIANGAKIRAKADRESSGVLAWSYLPNNNCNEILRQSYNNRYTWEWRLLWSTICHEIGHAIGLSHGGRGIMQPASDPSVMALDQWDIDQVVKRYGHFKGDTKLPDYGTDSFL